MNILHLSDIHFGREHSGISDNFDKKDEILNKLIYTIANLPEDMKPDLVLVTGDIAWTGKIVEFNAAFEWFQKLRKAAKIDADRILFCPGNHDLNRKTATRFCEEELKRTENGYETVDIDKCDELYKYDNAHVLETRFHNYNTFCERMGMQPYSYENGRGEKEYSYLIGSNEFEFGGARYMVSCFNTAYLPYGTVLNDDQMFLGLPQIESMIERGLMSDPNIYRIAVFHHADRYLHPAEQCEYDGRKASLPLLMKYVDLALCGHTETGGVPLMRTFKDGGSLLSGGAAYYNDDHPNSFSILQIDKGKLPIVCSYYYDGNQWSCFSDEESFSTGICTPLIWKDNIHNYPTFSFAIQIGNQVAKLFSGSFATQIVVVEQDKFNVFYNNFVNPAREIDVFVDNNGVDKQPHRLGIRNAPGMWHTMEAQILLAKYQEFVKRHLPDANCAFHGLINDEGRWLIKTDLNIEKLKKDYKNYSANVNWYKKIQDIEDYFEVIFLFPEEPGPTENDEMVISWLEEIIERGDLALLCEGIINSWFFAHEKKK